eukprot:tig00021357_g20738.t1
MGVNKNQWIEEWAYMRENTHRTFKMTPKNSVLGLIFAVAVPAVLYIQARADQAATDKRNGRDFKYL